MKGGEGDDGGESRFKTSSLWRFPGILHHAQIKQARLAYLYFDDFFLNKQPIWSVFFYNIFTLAAGFRHCLKYGLTTEVKPSKVASIV